MSAMTVEHESSETCLLCGETYPYDEVQCRLCDGCFAAMAYDKWITPRMSNNTTGGNK
jgi:hypothetical protein